MSTAHVLDTDIVISGLGPVSTYGTGRTEPAGTPVDPGAAGGSQRWLRSLEDFDPARWLGRKGWRFLPPAARYAMVAARLADEDARSRGDDGDTGVVVGTNFAADETVDRFDQAVLAEGARGISPLEAPNFSINVAASQISIDLGHRAFNITLTDLFVAGSCAVWTACQALEDGRATAALAGAVEGRPPRAATGSLAPVLDEGAACLMRLEHAGRAAARDARPYGRVVAGAQLFVPVAVTAGADRVDALAHPVLDELAAALPPGPVTVDVCRPPASQRAEAVAAAVIRWTRQRLDTALLGGPDAGRAAAQASATAPLRLAGALAGRAAPPGALIQATAGPHGHLVVLAVRTTP